MLTATRGDTQIIPSKPYVTVLGKLLVAAIILTPLLAMLFPELNHRSGNNASKSVQAASAAPSSVNDVPLTPFSARRTDQ
jgi:hypothetical protein